jgi:hypothetical protein
LLGYALVGLLTVYTQAQALRCIFWAAKIVVELAPKDLQCERRIDRSSIHKPLVGTDGLRGTTGCADQVWLAGNLAASAGTRNLGGWARGG